VLTRLRLAAGGTTLAAGLWLLASAAAAPPDMPKDAYKRAIEAEVTAIQKNLNGGMPDKRAANTIRGQAMMIAVYAEATKDSDLAAQAIKVAEAMAKKDWTGADKEAKLLASPPKGGKVKGPLEQQAKFDLDAAMSAFRLGKVGGLNIEADIRSMAKGGNIDAKAAELIAVRSAAIGSYAIHYPNEKATANTMNKSKWEKLSKDMMSISKDIAEEAGKGGDQKKLTGLFKRLDANCTNCHNDFRD
jgi:hypothetical protein